jgi:hypothetical protein
MNNFIKANVELIFGDCGEVYLNYWECGDSREINCQIKGDEIHKFVHNTSENEELEKSNLEYNPFKQRKISLSEFVEMVKDRAKAKENGKMRS